MQQSETILVGDVQAIQHSILAERNTNFDNAKMCISGYLDIHIYGTILTGSYSV